MSEPILELKNIVKHFSEGPVLNGISLAVQPGEFITLLGSSGCGKTTTLRIIAGLESCDSGQVLLEGRDVTDEPPERRGVNMVFQNYALFPHMSVEANIGYSLKIRRRNRAEIRKAVTDALALVQLSGFEGRMPSELSGGQRQRVAIAGQRAESRAVLCRSARGGRDADPSRDPGQKDGLRAGQKPLCGADRRGGEDL